MATRRQISVCLAVVAVPLGLLGCGGGDGSLDLEGEPFSEQEMRDFTENLDEIDGLVLDGDCEAAESKVSGLVSATDDFPEERDETLKSELITALGKLQQQISDECLDEEPADTSSTTSTEESTTSTTTDPEPEETTDSTTTEPEEPEETTPPEEDPGPPVDPPGEGTPPVDPGGGNEEGESGGVGPGFEADRRIPTGSSR